jgi:hypothetical protein
MLLVQTAACAWDTKHDKEVAQAALLGAGNLSAHLSAKQLDQLLSRLVDFLQEANGGPDAKKYVQVLASIRCVTAGKAASVLQCANRTGCRIMVCFLSPLSTASRHFASSCAVP